ncbi:hypothetical protein [Bartonella sp. AP40SXNS]|uniref:hypothetical protein n=1 Tax=Bartonella sp. AP40SXNS TaxID=3243495 RepID=UPI0035CEF63C
MIDFYHDAFIFFPISEITQIDIRNIAIKSGIQKSRTVHTTLNRLDIFLKHRVTQGWDVD